MNLKKNEHAHPSPHESAMHLRTQQGTQTEKNYELFVFVRPQNH